MPPWRFDPSKARHIRLPSGKVTGRRPIYVIGPPRARAGLLSRSHRGPFGKIEEAIPNGPAVARHPHPFAAGAAAVRGSSRRRGYPNDAFAAARCAASDWTTC
jgi:hypothetical protein